MTDLDLVSLHKAYAEGTSPAAVVDEIFTRLAALDDPGIFIALSDRAALEAAIAALGPFDPKARPLWGVPFAVKDNIDVAGLPTTAACPDYAYRPSRSASVVERLTAAGALVIGKTNLDQFATGLVGVRTPYPVPRNSFDPSLVPGGSSSGSAVAVGHGLVTFSLGTDTAGSGRVPAALNNIVGLKPSLGLLSTTGVVPACRTLDCVSIFAMTVDDAEAVLAVAAGYDAVDPYSRALPVVRTGLPPKLRIGVPTVASRIFGGDGTAQAAFEATLATAAGQGDVVPVDLTPFYEVAALLYEGAWVAERYQAIRAFIENRPQALHPVTRGIIEGATTKSAADAFAGQYRLKELARRTAPVWKDIDLLLVPSIPDVCTLADIAAEPVAANSRLGTYTNFVNLLDLSALAVPGSFRRDGLPAGVTLIGPAGADGLLAAFGRAIHAAAGVPMGATGRALPPSKPASAAAPDGFVEIAVVGAHLSGMALNHELTSRGGVLVRPATTAPDYQLFALAGGPPHRPGMVRVAEGGSAIAIEVWALPAEGFARFVAAIPAPLGIGTVRLADGGSVKGFLCENLAVADARDITAFGGWRAFVAAG